MNYALEISSYEGFVAGASHYRGRVVGEHPKSCHGGTTLSGGKWMCSEGHELPKRVDWEVEAEWTEERYERYAALQFEGDGPGQFASEDEVIEAARRRFLGEAPARWWEEKPITGQPGDKLYLGYIATDLEYVDGKWGTVVAEVPAMPLRDQIAAHLVQFTNIQRWPRVFDIAWALKVSQSQVRLELSRMMRDGLVEHRTVRRNQVWGLTGDARRTAKEVAR